MNLENIKLSEQTKKNLLAIGYSKLTDIQEKVIPLALSGKDIIGLSQTGTGKTASFIIPVLENLKKSNYPQVLVLVPTRELAHQVNEETRKLSQHLKLRTLAIYGGTSIKDQLRSLRFGVDVVIGTPGRIIDHLTRKTLRLDNLKFVILDEADEMINKGFLANIKEIIKMAPTERQTLLFSATTSPDIEIFSRRFLKNPQTIIGEKGKNEENNIQQYYLDTTSRQKSKNLIHFLHLNKTQLILIFANTKRKVEEIGNLLRSKEMRVDYIHSDLSQNRRTRVLNKFRNRQFLILIATDVAARGIHVDDIDYVINYDFPQSPEFYIHRIGRTGRAGASGKAITFITSPREKQQLLKLVKQKNYQINALPAKEYL
ncbi:2366_t:CDS:1 [Funneliformis geosporum]|uniref:RNA helicase n=1 Tax=Funneliformis geosporum TaxID=1117311 RepID=A0A9W4T5J6_9GLOM|nr:2366_t:CDS:1 [Funneliformis geosporum]CAI2192868.1 1242_t:CDS:1 [Funneliformis geosporum]